jgi:PAS domain S-box-containing protein
MFGYTAQEAIGKNISLIIPDEYLSREKDILKRIQNNEIIEHYETVRIKKNGEQFFVSLTASPLKDLSGNIIGVSKIARDISGQKQSEQEIKMLNDQLEKHARELIVANKELVFENTEKEKRAAELLIANTELLFQNCEKEKRATELLNAISDLKFSAVQFEEVNKELESFSYSVSHDLRAPLRAVHGYSKMLKENYEIQLDSEGNRLVNNIMSNAKKMGQLIDDLLRFSRIGRKDLIKSNIAMFEMVTSVCNELKNELPDRNIEFNIRPMPSALGDNISVKHIWLNLVSNAIKYSRLKEKSIIEIGSETKENEIIYYIKDNGAGFDMRYVNKLFGVFQRLHSDQEFEGTGVGLALVQRIVLKHGGKVWACGEVDKGATFYFTL